MGRIIEGVDGIKRFLLAYDRLRFLEYMVDAEERKAYLVRKKAGT